MHILAAFLRVSVKSAHDVPSDGNISSAMSLTILLIACTTWSANADSQSIIVYFYIIIDKNKTYSSSIDIFHWLAALSHNIKHAQYIDEGWYKI